MKDRYLFKAKRTDNEEWVQGCCFTQYERFFIKDIQKSFATTIYNEPSVVDFNVRAYEVASNTVCQCTGLKDKNGKLIWENDIVFVTDGDGCSGQIDTGVGEIDFLEGLWYISGKVQNALYDIDKCFQLEVIGNIFDNPDLLEMGV